MGFGKDGKGVIRTNKDLITLGGLASGSVEKQDNPQGITEDWRLIKVEGSAWLEDLTSSEGPILFGVSSDKLSAAEIAEAITGNGPNDPEGRVQAEVASRPVFILGVFRGNTQDDPELIKGICEKYNVSEGRFDKTIRWTFSDNSGHTYWAINLGTGQLTSGGYIPFVVKEYGVWVK